MTPTLCVGLGWRFGSVKTISLIILLLLPCAALAVPSISGVSGNIDHDQTGVTISGSDFGSKSTAAPTRWETFDDYGNNGDTFADLYAAGGWWRTDRDTSNDQVTLSSQYQRTGEGLAARIYMYRPGGYYANIHKNGIFPANRALVSFWVRYDRGTPDVVSLGEGQIKLWRINHSTNANIGPWFYYRNNPWAGWTVHPDDTPSGINNTDVNYYGNEIPSDGTWSHIQVEFDQGTADTADGHIKVWINGNLRINDTSAALYYSNLEAAGRSYRSVRFGEYVGNTATLEATEYFDDIYLDTSWARVELGDRPDYGNCTHREMQVPTSWAADEIEVTINAGTFGSGQQAYLFVVDSDGAASDGYAVTMGSVQDDSPAAPSNLIASAGIGLANLLWSPNNEDDLAGYRAYRSLTADGTYGQISGLIPAGTTSFTAMGLTAGQTYHFKVKAEDDAGYLSPFSNRAEVTIETDAVAPATPTGLSAVGGILMVTLSWTPNGEPDIAGYNVFRSDSSQGNYKKLNTNLVKTNGYVDTAVVAERTYYYKVNAVDTSGNGSENSAEVSAYVDGEPDEPPDTPTGLTATAAVEAIDLEWGVVYEEEGDLAGYFAHRSLVNGGPYKQINPVAITDTFLTDSGLTAGVTYHYVVQSVDAAGQRSAYSEPDSAVADAPEVTAPAAPTGLKATAGEEEVDLEWLENTEVDLLGYYVYRANSEGGTYTALNTEAQADTTYNDTDVTAYETYWYKVQAENDSNEFSDFSDSVSATPYGPPPAVSVLAPDSLYVYTGQRFDLPVYAHWGWKTFESHVPLSSEDYDHIATHDVYHLPQEALIDTIYQSVVDSVRARNPNTVFTVHMQVMGWKPVWAGWTRYYEDLYNLAMAHPTWSVKNINGDYITGQAYGTIYWNPYAMDEGLNDSLAVIFDKWTTFRDINRPRVGIFADWIAGNFPAWPFPDSLQHMDFDQDGIPYGTGPNDPLYGDEWLEDEAKYDARNVDLARGFRDNISEPTFLVVPNVVNSKTNMAIVNGHLWDGMMFEGFQKYEPSNSAAQFYNAMTNVYKSLNHSRVSPPLVFWQGEEHTTLTSIEVIGAMMRGLSVFHQDRGEEAYEEAYTLPDDLNLGRMVGEPTYDGNVFTANFSSSQYNTTAKLRFVQANGSNTLPWDFIVVTSYDHVLRRNGDWPEYSGYVGY